VADRGLGPGLLSTASDRILQGLGWSLGIGLVGLLGYVWAARLTHPFDLEWMEGGVLTHAWRLQRGLPLYVTPGPDFVPFLYPPGYPALVAFFGAPTGLSPAVGRLLSVGGTALSAGAIAYSVRERGGSALVAFGAAAMWLGTYPVAGAFFDLVRPDAVGVAAMAWAVALSLRPRRGSDIAAGLLVALAGLVKHNLGIVALPLLAGWWAHDRRSATRFAAAGGLPALLVVGMVHLRSGGRFLTYLLEVPASHVMVWERAITATPWELSRALAVPLVLMAFVALFGALRHRGRLPRGLVAGLGVVPGFVAGWAFTYAPAPPAAGASPLALAVTVAALVSILTSLLLLAGSRAPVDREDLVLGGVVAVCTIGSGLMRVHDGGYANVQMPMFWAGALVFGVVLAGLEATPLPRRLGHAALALTLAVAIRGVPGSSLVPTAADVARGRELVAPLRGLEGPVVSPFASWLPTYAGHPPSLHAQAVWDLDYPGGPFVDDVERIRRAIRERHWRVVVGGNFPLVRGLPFNETYAPGPLIVRPNEGPLRPKTGFVAMPLRLLGRE